MHKTAFAVTLLAVTAGWVAPASATGSTCVGRDRGCFRTLQTAVDATPDGGTIRVERGSFAGGVVVTHSVRIIGEGAGRTLIRGGNSVVTVQTLHADHRPAVRLEGLTLTGGVAHGDGVVAVGGGLRVEPLDGGGLGAAVTLDRVEVRGNRTEPTTTDDSPSGAQCGDVSCPFAGSFGGGIFNGGDLTLVDSVVRGNQATGNASDADGAGVFSDGGTLTIRSSRITDNIARPLSIGRFAEGGGVMIEGGGPLTVRDTVVAGNAAVLQTGFGLGVDMNANSGGIHIGNNVSGATLLDSRISRNRVVVDAPNGDAADFDSAVLAYQAPLTVRRSEIRDNTLTANVATSDNSGLSGSTIEFDGPGEITDTAITDNSAYAHSAGGAAQTSNGLTVFNFLEGDPGQVTARRLRISGNTARAVSETGSAVVTGAGVINNSLLALSDSVVRDNRATASAPVATSQGAGIWNGVLLSGPPVQLRLRGTQVTGNIAATSTGGTAQGGGLYTDDPASVSLVDTVIARNRPDQCFGCTPSGARERSLQRLGPRPRSGLY